MKRPVYAEPSCFSGPQPCLISDGKRKMQMGAACTPGISDITEQLTSFHRFSDAHNRCIPQMHINAPCIRTICLCPIWVFVIYCNTVSHSLHCIFRKRRFLGGCRPANRAVLHKRRHAVGKGINRLSDTGRKVKTRMPCRKRLAEASCLCRISILFHGARLCRFKTPYTSYIGFFLRPKDIRSIFL